MIDQWLESLSSFIDTSMWFSPLIALLAGIITALTPCSLSSIPLVIGYIGGVGKNDTKRSFKLSLLFAVGMAITYTILGTLASLLGRLMGTSSNLWYIFLGILMVLMALQTWEVYNFIPSTYLTSKNTRKGYLGALLVGILGGIFASPCSTPVLVVLLSIVAKQGSILWGVLLLLLYSIGHSTLVILAGTFMGVTKKISGSRRYGIFSTIVKYLTGTLILLLAFYMFYLGF